MAPVHPSSRDRRAISPTSSSGCSTRASSSPATSRSTCSTSSCSRSSCDCSSRRWTRHARWASTGGRTPPSSRAAPNSSKRRTATCASGSTASSRPCPRRDTAMAATDARASAWWFYCIVGADRELPGDLAGVSTADPPALIEEGNVAAVASRVPLDEFGEAPLRANLNDLAWLERTVRAHEAVLDAMLPGGALVPMRVCTIYSDEAQVREMLDARGALFDHVLAGLAGKAEWGMKVVADRAQLEAHARRETGADAEAAGKSEAGAYLA